MTNRINKELNIDFGANVAFVKTDTGYRYHFVSYSNNSGSTVEISYNGTDVALTLPAGGIFNEQALNEELIYTRIQGGVAVPGETLQVVLRNG